MTTRTHAERLEEIARQAMIKYGLEPDWPPGALRELTRAEAAPAAQRDLRHLPWTSIDNAESRDLDQLEVCVDGAVPRLLIAIADVDVLVPRGSALDAH